MRRVKRRVVLYVYVLQHGGTIPDVLMQGGYVCDVLQQIGFLFDLLM